MDRSQRWLVLILTAGVFGIINTEMGVIGILPAITAHFHVSLAQAGLLVSLFALCVAVTGPVLPALLAGVNRKGLMLGVLGLFILSNVVSLVTEDFSVLLAARIVPAIFHPVYCAMAFTAAAAAVPPGGARRAVAFVVAGVSAGMVIGVPVSSFLAETVSLSAAWLFFAAVNGVVFLATWFWIPTLPVGKKTSFLGQLKTLKRPEVILSLTAVVFMNGAVFGVFNYLAAYLQGVTAVPAAAVSLLLFLYGLSNIGGSMAAGRLLSSQPMTTVRYFSFVLAAMYGLIFLGGSVWPVMTGLIFFWGILGGINANINQYWISQALPEAPDFANGIFLTAANLGTMAGTSVNGVFIGVMGLPYTVFGGFLFACLSGAVVLYQTRAAFMEKRTRTAGVVFVSEAMGQIEKIK